MGKMREGRKVEEKKEIARSFLDPPKNQAPVF